MRAPARRRPLLSAALAPLAALAALAIGCAAVPRQAECEGPAPPAAEARSLFGRPLAAPPLNEEVRARRTLELEQARERIASDDLVWVGRRLAYLGRFNDAVLIFRAGQAVYPDDARFARHLGHRWITLRRFADAEQALERAARLERGRPDQVEPDGQPNARGVPLTTLQSNIHYHLGLARYLRGDHEGALAAWDDYRAVSRGDDGLVAVDHWSWMALARLGRRAEADALVADVRADMDIVENHGYHRLCLLYRGELSPEDLLGGPEGGAADGPAVDDATLGYGLGNWHYVHGRVDEALAVWRRVLRGEAWHAFGYVAAEADLHRLGLHP